MNIPTIIIPELQTKDGNTTSLRLEPLMHSNKTDYASMLHKAYQNYDTVQYLPKMPLPFKASRDKCAELADNYAQYNQYYSNAAKVWHITENQQTIGCINLIAQNILAPEIFGRTILLLPDYINQGLGKQLNIVSYDVMFRMLEIPATLFQYALQNKRILSVKNTLRGWQDLPPIDVNGKMINPEATTLLRSQLTRQDYLDNAHNIIAPHYYIQHDYSLSNRMGCE